MWDNDYGIVFSGGGALGAWEVGCYRAIRSRHGDRAPAVVTGASAGAINAVGVCAGMQAQQLQDTWAKIGVADVYRTLFGKGTLLKLISRAAFGSPLTVEEGFLKNTRSVFDTAPLKQTLTGILDGYYQPFTQSPTRCALAVTNLAQGRRELFYKVPPGDAFQPPTGAAVLWQQITSQDMLVQALMGSTALPVLFPPYESYFDGGVLLNQPITPAIALEALNLFVVIPSAQKLGSTTDLQAIASTLLTTWLSASMITQMDTIRVRNQLRKYTGDPLIRICLIRPPQDITEKLGPSLLSFGKKVKEMADYGEVCANDRLNTFDPAKESTWY